MKNKKTLVLGASTNPARYANMAIHRLRQNKIAVVALGLRSGLVKDVEIDTENKAYKEIHTVTLYLNPSRQEQYYDYIISLKPQRVIFNPGTENPAFEKRLATHGIQTIIACTLVMLATKQY